MLTDYGSTNLRVIAIADSGYNYAAIYHAAQITLDTYVDVELNEF